MAECYEFEGKTLEKAIQKACKALKLPKESLRHEVITSGSSGIFGLVGARKARIKVCSPDALSKTVDDAAQSRVDEAVGAAPIVERSGEGGETPGAENAEDVAELGREVIQKIIDTMTTGATIRVVRDDGRLGYDIKGGNLGIMIGKRGQTLEAIHYLAEKIVNKNRQKRVRIEIDVGGYLHNRRQNLRQLAAQVAEKARLTGKPATVGQMNAHDRRIIHMALRDDGHVRTQSVGAGFMRKLVVFPKRRTDESCIDFEDKN